MNIKSLLVGALVGGAAFIGSASASAEPGPGPVVLPTPSFIEPTCDDRTGYVQFTEPFGNLNDPEGKGYALAVFDMTTSTLIQIVTAEELAGATKQSPVRVPAPPGDEVVVGTNSVNTTGGPWFHTFASRIVGTAKADTLRGTPGRDVIVAKGGADVIRGRGGNDVICAGNGNDKVYGDDGKDQVFGQGGRDTLVGGKHADVLNGGPGRDVCNGGPGRDRAAKCEVRRSIP